MRKCLTCGLVGSLIRKSRKAQNPQSQEVAVNKSELVEAVGKTTGLAKRDAENAVNALVHTIVSEVKAGRRVAIVGFGAFRPTRRAARKGRNPQTGAPVQIRASKGVSFGASNLFKEIVNGKSPLGSPKLHATAGTAATPARATTAGRPSVKATARKAAAAKTPRQAATAKTAARKVTAKKAVATKAPARKASATKTTAKATVRKAAATKTTAKATVRKAAATKTTAKTTAKATARKAVATKTTARKAATAKVPARRGVTAGARSAGRPVARTPRAVKRG